MSYNWLFYGVIHDGIASYAHFHDVCLIFVIYTKRILYLFGCTHIIILTELNERVNEMLEHISAPEAAKKWGISERRVQKLCEENRIPGVAKFSRLWLIPKDAKKPADKRKRKENRKWKFDNLNCSAYFGNCLICFCISPKVKDLLRIYML